MTIDRRSFDRGLLAAGAAATLDPFRRSARADRRAGLAFDDIVVGAGAAIFMIGGRPQM